jgi:hypothetical protein
LFMWYPSEAIKRCHPSVHSGKSKKTWRLFSVVSLKL